MVRRRASWLRLRDALSLVGWGDWISSREERRIGIGGDVVGEFLLAPVRWTSFAL